MKLITRDTDYAVRALAFMAQNEEKAVSAALLFNKLKIPRPFLRKILQILTNEGILKSFKGSGGGFLLMKNPEKIFLIDLVEIFQGPLKINECLFKGKICPNTSSCVLKSKIDKISGHVAQELRKITVASLLRS